MSEEGEALAQHVAAELRDPEPKGFTFDEAVLRQDASLTRLSEHLGQEPEAQVAEALGRLLEQERDGWAQLKILELADRLAPAALAPALLQYVEARRKAEEPRVRFLAGRACEVLLRLPLDRELRAKAQAISAGPLQEVASARGQALRARAMHRPRRVEWLILVAMMVLGIAGLLYAFQALR
jgi:hypothetical protein